mmetsp:Transcript_11859/g.24374  ORF Transcript_11859/g.24374 Transcript_11859/m.24374 type:complete len:222 (-) Transcript_11859:2548-3213(-)
MRRENIVGIILGSHICLLQYSGILKKAFSARPMIVQHNIFVQSFFLLFRVMIRKRHIFFDLLPILPNFGPTFFNVTPNIASVQMTIEYSMGQHLFQIIQTFVHMVQFEWHVNGMSFCRKDPIAMNRILMQDIISIKCQIQVFDGFGQEETGHFIITLDTLVLLLLFGIVRIGCIVHTTRGMGSNIRNGGISTCRGGQCGQFFQGKIRSPQPTRRRMMRHGR